MDEFSENFRTAFAPPPPPLFRKISLRFFPQTGCAGTKFAMKFFRSEMTPPFFEVFLEIHDKKSCFKCKKIAMKFFRSEMTPPPLSEIFRKFIRFGGDRLPLKHTVACLGAKCTLMHQMMGEGRGGVSNLG